MIRSTIEEARLPREMRIEQIQVPASDIDRAKSFYVEKVGRCRRASSFDTGGP
jgi:hypothetical protein